MCLRFVSHFPHVKGKKQKGQESFYRRRTPKNSEIFVHNTIAKLFNHFRVADNQESSPGIIGFSHNEPPEEIKQAEDDAEDGQVGFRG